MADETNLDAGVGRCAHRGDGQHAAHRIDVIGERLHNGGIIRAKQGDIVGGNRFGGLAGGGLYLDASQSGGRNRALSNGVGHIIGAGIGGLERQRHIRRIGGRRSAVGRIHLSQLCRLQGSAMHVRGQLDDGIRVGNGGFRYRVDDRGQGVRGLDREIHHAGAGRRAVGDGDLDAHASRRQRTGVERKLAVGSGGHLHRVGVLGHSGDQSERVSIRIVEAAQRIGGITGSLLHIDLGRSVELYGSVVAAIIQGYGHRGGRGLAAAIGNIVSKGNGACGCGGGIELQIPAVVNRRNGDVFVVWCANLGDFQHGTIGLLVIAQHVENLFRTGSCADFIILGFDLAGLCGTGLGEVVVVVGRVVVLLFFLGLLGLYFVPLYFDDFGGILRVPHIAVNRVVEHHKAMVGAEHQFGSSIDGFEGLRLDAGIRGGAGANVVAGLLAPSRVHAALGRYRSCRIRLAPVGYEIRLGIGLQRDKRKASR